MKWPWEVVAEAKDGEIAGLKAERDRWQLRYDLLLDKYHALRAAGANPAPEVSEPLPPKEPDVVTQAILSETKLRHLPRDFFTAYVASQRRDGLDEEAIAAAIRMGQDDADGVP